MYLQKGFALLITNGNLNYDIVSGKDVTIRVSTNWSWRSVTGSQTVTHWTLGQCHTLTLLHTGHWDSVTGSHCYTLDTETVSQAHILLHTGHWDSVTGSHCYTLDTETVSQAHIVTHWTLRQCHRLTLLHTEHWRSVTGSHCYTLDTETVSQAHILLHTEHWRSVTGSDCYTAYEIPVDMISTVDSRVVVNCLSERWITCHPTNPFQDSANPEEHFKSVWRTVVQKSSATTIVIVAHSYGGHVVVEFVREFTAFGLLDVRRQTKNKTKQTRQIDEVSPQIVRKRLAARVSVAMVTSQSRNTRVEHDLFVLSSPAQR